jgi:hypothetical protein
MYDKAQEIAFAFVLSVQNLLLLKRYSYDTICMACHKFRIILLYNNQNIILLYHYSFYWVNLNRFFWVDKLIGVLQFQDFAIFQNFLRQKGSVSFDLVDKRQNSSRNPFH